MGKKIKPIVLLLLAIVACYCGYSIYKEPIWRYETLFLFLSVWLILLGLFERQFTVLLDFKKYITWSLLSGVLLWLGFPPIGLSPVLLIAWMPLLSIERDISLRYGGIKKREVFKFAFATAMTWNILTTYWVGNSALMAGVFAIVANSLLMTLPWVLGHVVRHKMPKLGYAPLVCFWLIFEYIHFRWDLAWPWLTLGNGFASFHSWVQWYDVLGVLGGSLWIWVCNISIYNLWQKKLKNELNVSSYFPPLLAVLVPLAISLYQYYTFKESGETIEVVCMQPNQEPHYLQGTLSNIQTLEQSMVMAEDLIDTTTQYVLFPESTFNQVDEGDLESNDIIRAFQMITNMEFPDLNILAGISGFKRLESKDLELPTTRVQANGKDTIYYHIYNGAVQVGGQQIQTYKKSKLVIGPEYMPFSSRLGFLENFVSKLGGTVKGFATQDEREVFESTKGNAAPVICYEQDFGAFMRGYIRNGADFIAIVTNDGWWGNTAGFKQHREFARLRAIEYRRDIARAANTGSSCFINARGDISQATEYDVETAIKGDVHLNTTITNYAKMGDMVGRLAGFLAIIFLLNVFVLNRLGKKDGE